ncbi:TIGR03083 family protein [Streptomyces sp. DvalAA-14]|uniref:maleylpyruvate isomerase family mycothiol-dependent enzyme n=1 Tax=unclassified Streptomyces TaxID=2593676 RepID=UPI00081B05CE|nr:MULTISPECIES: maleylpyruvate isomerase family mycothiol-dependent enzyme [unclassified Streptomyces]MYS24582.1 maleylpyruvate isomerase family mycothiol-dependent enzyme [Streptomyces sp. SID4948]SCE47413.1 TIGR03083 family protein [Streptomyces sp. DvalAA-14]
MPTPSRRPRTYDPGRTWAALVAQVGHVREAAAKLTPQQWAAPSGLPGWDVRLLVVHIVRQVEALRVILAEQPAPRGTKPVGLDAWARSTAAIADQLDASTRTAAATTADPVAALDAEAALLGGQQQEALRTDRLTTRPFGGMRALDFTVTRLVELVVHGDDLARATGVEVTMDRQALAAVVRLLADALATAAPGNSVEVRIPPYAAVQCVEGPRHTRGTPPNVVETDPLTWIRLATGRESWAEALAAARVAASGERADLGPYLPVMG